MKKFQTSGFTILETSIVLFIIGFIVTAIFGGREILEITKRNSVISDLKKYNEAYANFKERYLAAPGDLSDAASYWSVATNGNGNGKIEYDSDATNRAETYQAWMHMSLANFIDAYYSGAKSTGATELVAIGKDIPEGPYEQSGYTIYAYEVSTIAGVFNKIDAILFGKGTSVHDVTGGIMNPTQALYIDEKMDDNNPLNGRIWTWGTTGSGTGTHCINFSNDADYTNDTYNTATDTEGCYIINYTSDVNKL